MELGHGPREGGNELAQHPPLIPVGWDGQIDVARN